MQRKVFVFTFISLVLIATASYIVLKNDLFGTNSTNIAAQPVKANPKINNGYLHANIGGMDATIPPFFAQFVEYDDVPSSSKIGLSNTSAQPPQKKLKSFGFYVRYPDMAGLSSAELIDDRRKQDSDKRTWMLVGFNSWRNYPGDGFLDKWVNSVVGKPNTILPTDNFEKLSESEYGLEVYAAAGIDPVTQIPYRQNKNSDDVFIYRNISGKIETTIRCKNKLVVAPTCEQSFSLEPKAKSVVSAHYSRYILPNWRSIQDSIRQLVFSFEEIKSP